LQWAGEPSARSAWNVIKFTMAHALSTFLFAFFFSAFAIFHLHGLFRSPLAWPLSFTTCMASFVHHLHGLFRSPFAWPLSFTTCMASFVHHLHGLFRSPRAWRPFALLAKMYAARSFFGASSELTSGGFECDFTRESEQASRWGTNASILSQTGQQWES
jgi:hypothetical protein